ncbi:MAG: KH domain-containing protein [Firmicutes bacterium]|nr:KH domain-containing protein [Bacillota bacterium]
MKKTFEFVAKKVEDAIETGLTTLGVSYDEAIVEVVSNGGFLKKAKVAITIEVPDDSPAVKGEKKPSAEVKKEEPKKEIKAAEKTVKPAAEKSDSSVSKKEVKAEKADKKAEKKADKKADKKTAAKAEAAEPSEEKAPPKKKLFEKKPADKKVDVEKSNEEPPEFLRPKKKLFEKKHKDNYPSVPHKNFKKRDNASPADEESARRATDFLNAVMEKANISAAVKSNIGDELNMELDTEESLVIGYRGETLDALQYLTSIVVNTTPGKYINVTLDACGYRAKRSDTLRKLASKMADKCLAQNRRISLDPMNNSDRKEIHSFLAEIPGVVTRSEGSEPARRIVIYPERKPTE